MKSSFKKITAILLVLILITIQNSFSQVLITDDGTLSPDGSAMLEIKSETKGMLIPRISSINRNLLETSSSAVPGLLVFDFDLGSFFIYGKTAKGTNGWVDLSAGGTIWEKSGNNIYLANSNYNVGIGTDKPSKKFVLKAENDKDTLFEILDMYGKPLMIITPVLSKFYFNASAKGVAGGFAVGRYATAKAISDTALFLVTPDSTRVYTSGATAQAGGFAVGRYATAKGESTKYFHTDVDSTRVYTSSATAQAGGFAVGRYATAKGENAKKYFFTDVDSTRVYTDGSGTKGVAGGFAVGRYATAKAGGTDNYMYMIPDNYFIGHQSGEALQNSNYTGKYNTFFGFQTGMNDTVGKNNVFIGYKSGYSNTGDIDGLDTLGSRNVFLGYEAGYKNSTGTNNVFLGTKSGFSNTTGGHNVFLGYLAGEKNSTGSYNSFLGYNAGQENTTGFLNTFVGYNAGGDNTTGRYNVFVGPHSGRSNLDGHDNVFVGTDAGGLNVTSHANVFVGFQAGLNHNPNAGSGDNNVYIGNAAGKGSTDASGTDNVYIGTKSGFMNTTGSSNVFLGTSCAYENTTGANNVMIGDSAGYNNTTAVRNISIGHVAGFSNQTAVNNICIGDSAGYTNTEENNIFIGTSAGQKNTTGKFNVFLGEGAGFSTIDKGGNVYVGTLAGAQNNESNNTMIGNLSGYMATTGGKNVFLGDGSGFFNNGTRNVFLGYSSSTAGETSNNILIGSSLNPGTVSNKLIIDGTEDETTPLIYGDFSLNHIGINTNNPQGDFHIVGSNLLGRLVVSPNEVSGGDDAEICLAEDDDYTTGMSMKYDGGVNRMYFFGKSGATVYGPHMSIALTSGEVGFGIADPSTNVEIHENSATTTPMFELDQESLTGDASMRFITNGGNTFSMGVDATDDNFRICDYSVLSTSTTYARLVISGAGRVGIRRTPTARNFEVDGGASKTTAGDWGANSDKRIKTDILDIENARETLLKLRPVKFKYTDEWKKRNPTIKDHYYYNYIAQEYKKVFPESVQGSGEYLEGDDTEILQLDSYNSQVITTKAVQELIIENKTMNSKIETLEKQIQELKDLIQNK